MRSLLFAGLLLVVPLAGCQSLGIGDADPQEMAARYTDEHSSFLEVDGRDVHVHVEGEGPAILMLHGMLDSLHAWDDWAEQLVDDYRVIRIDVPPFGLSDAWPHRDYAPGHYVAVFDAVLDRHDVASAVVVGNSLGGFFAAYYAAHAPERVKALTLISPAGYPQAVPWRLRLAAMPVIGKPFEYVTPRFLVRQSLRSMYGERLEEEAVQRRFDLIRVPGNRPAGRDVIRLMVARADEEPGWVTGIHQPTLLIWGERDEWVPPELAERWAEDLQDVRLVRYPGAGHLPMEEVPDASVAEFRDFLSGRVTGDVP